MSKSNPRLPESVLLLVPPFVWVLGMGMAQGFGPPYMLRQFLGPGHNHSLVGLVLIFGSLFVCPVLAVMAGARLLRRGRAAMGSILIACALLLALAGMLVRQPYSRVDPDRAVEETAWQG